LGEKSHFEGKTGRNDLGGTVVSSGPERLLKHLKGAAIVEVVGRASVERGGGKKT